MNSTPTADELSPDRQGPFEKIVDDAIAAGTFGTHLDSLNEAQLSAIVLLLKAREDEASAKSEMHVPSDLQTKVNKAVRVTSLGLVNPGKKKHDQFMDAHTEWELVHSLLQQARAVRHQKFEHELDQNSKQTNRVRSLLERQYKGLGNSERTHIADEMKAPDSEWGVITVDRNAKDLDILSFVEQNLPAAQKIWQELEQKKEKLTNDTESIDAGFTLYVRTTPPYDLEISATEVFAYAEELKKTLIQANFLPKMEGLDNSGKKSYVPTIHVSTSNSCETTAREGYVASATIFVDVNKSVAENVAYIQSCLPRLVEHEKIAIQQEAEMRKRLDAEREARV